MKPIQVTITKYEADDGKVFDSMGDCIHYEEMKSGRRIECPHCDGNGFYSLENCTCQKEAFCCECDGSGWIFSQQVTKD